MKIEDEYWTLRFRYSVDLLSSSDIRDNIYFSQNQNCHKHVELSEADECKSNQL